MSKRAHENISEKTATQSADAGSVLEQRLALARTRNAVLKAAVAAQPAPQFHAQTSTAENQQKMLETIAAKFRYNVEHTTLKPPKHFTEEAAAAIARETADYCRALWAQHGIDLAAIDGEKIYEDFVASKQKS